MKRLGFTLIEMLAAIGLMLVLMGAVITFWSNLTLARERLSGDLELQRGVRIFYSNLETDLVCSLVGYGEYGAGVTGDEHSIRLLTRGIDLPRLSGRADSSDGIISDLQQVEYRFSIGSGLLEASRSGVGSGGAGDWFTLVEGVGEVRFRYHDGNGWSDDFNSWERGRLPAAVEVAVWLKRTTAVEDDEVLDSGRIGGDGDRGRNIGDNDESEDEDIYDPFAAAAADRVTEVPPDRVRVMVVPGGPDYEYGRSFEDVEDFDFDNDGAAAEGGNDR